MGNRKALILTTHPDVTGGVAHYYRVLKPIFPFDFDYHYVGNRQNASGGLYRNFVKRSFADVIGYIKKLRSGDYSVVMINPSLTIKCLRDYVFFLIGILMGYKVVIFFRGWEKETARIVFGSWVRIFFRPLKKSSAIIVLSQEFGMDVRKLAPDVPVYVETTVFDEESLREVDSSYVESRAVEARKLRILFLSRIEAYKGVLQCIDAFSLLKKQGIEIEMDIAGTGSEDDAVRGRISSLNDPNIRYLGNVGGIEKQQLLECSDIMLFPSIHGEGMPNTVVEAMGSGMAVLTTLVGGVRDFFVDGDMGLVLNGNDPVEIAEKIARFEDRTYLKSVAVHNIRFAEKYFYSRVIANRIDRILLDVKNGCSRSSAWYEGA